MRKKKFKIKINEDTMTTIVVYALLFCVAVVVVGLVLACKGVDVSAIVSSALGLFGLELGVCGLMTIFKRWIEKKDGKKGE